MTNHKLFGIIIPSEGSLLEQICTNIGFEIQNLTEKANITETNKTKNKERKVLCMKKNYIVPEIQTLPIAYDDIIRTSGTPGSPMTGKDEGEGGVGIW